MCGIWFSLGFPPDEAHIDRVAHRGPDGRGWMVFDSVLGPVALGHRRLSIIDLSEAAAQPMAYADGRYQIVYNGEIYNYLELRRELAAKGRSFRTQSDTEVLLAAYDEWGEAALDRLFGMFAFVIWDRETRTIFAARDRFGIKPLYFFATPMGVALASEIKQFIGLPGFAARLNIARVYDFLISGIQDHTGETLFADVGQLCGGECLRLDLRHWRPGEPVPVRRWYGILEPGTLDISEREAGERFRALLTESVHMHLRSDVPIGCCLSGGLDSSSIVCLMARELAQESDGARINTVSACFDAKRIDERPFMKPVVAHTNSIPHWCYPRMEDVFAEAEHITWHQDEPYGSTSIFAEWSVYKTARQARVKVMLDGQGSDELLAGYHPGFYYHYRTLIRERRFTALLRAVIERRLWHDAPILDEAQTHLLPLLPPSLARWLRRRDPPVVYHNWLDSEAFRPHLARSPFDTAREVISAPPVDSIGTLCLLYTQSLNLTPQLHWEDRDSMAHGIEARVPFLDHRLVELAIALGDKHKIVGGDTKRVLRRAMKGILPEVVRKRRDKVGYETPEEAWFRGPLREAVEGGIEDTLARFPGLLNAEETRAHAAEQLDGRQPVDFSLWRIVNLGIWGRLFSVAA